MKALARALAAVGVAHRCMTHVEEYMNDLATILNALPEPLVSAFGFGLYSAAKFATDFVEAPAAVAQQVAAGAKAAFDAAQQAAGAAVDAGQAAGSSQLSSH